MKNEQTFSDAELEEFMQLLQKKKAKAEEQIQFYSDQITEMSDNGKDENSIENSGYDTQLEQMIEYKQRTTKHLNDINNAIIRVKNKTFGLCTVTGQMIDKRRLMAVPTTTKSIEGKQILEAQKGK